MTAEELQHEYLLSTGTWIPAAFATEMLKDMNNPWLKKVLRRNRDDTWSRLGTSTIYTEANK